jgi:hypothetical protein
VDVLGTELAVGLGSIAAWLGVAVRLAGEHAARITAASTRPGKKRILDICLLLNGIDMSLFNTKFLQYY